MLCCHWATGCWRVRCCHWWEQRLVFVVELPVGTYFGGGQLCRSVGRGDCHCQYLSGATPLNCVALVSNAVAADIPGMQGSFFNIPKTGAQSVARCGRCAAFSPTDLPAYCAGHGACRYVALDSDLQKPVLTQNKDFYPADCHARCIVLSKHDSTDWFLQFFCFYLCHGLYCEYPVQGAVLATAFIINFRSE